MLTGSARAAQEAREKAAVQLRREAVERKRRDLERKRRALEAQILALRTQFENEADEIKTELASAATREQVLESDKIQMSRLRVGDESAKGKRERNGKGA
jgi:circadian clock protein KaiC